MSDTITDRTIESIVRQWAGGEHKLAGARASELVYGSSKTPNQKLMATVVDQAPGIERYISAPESPITKVSDQSGDPLSRQPENDTTQNTRSNLSSPAARSEQNEIDAKLAAGRERREKAGASADIGSTELNPEGSSADNYVDPKSDARKATKKK